MLGCEQPLIIIIIIKYIYPRDLSGNTALHYAAQSGLKRSVFIPTFAHFLKLRPSVQLSWPSTPFRCVEFLIGHSADLFIENSSGQTACDLAVACGHHQVLKNSHQRETVNVESIS